MPKLVRAIKQLPENKKIVHLTSDDKVFQSINDVKEDGQDSDPSRFLRLVSVSYRDNKIPDEVQHRQTMSIATLEVPSEDGDQWISTKLLAADTLHLHVVEYFRSVDLDQPFADVDQDHHTFT